MVDGGPRLSLVVLRVRELEASWSFYERVGLDLRPEQHGRGPAHLSTVVGDTVVELYPRGGGPESAGTRLGLLVPDLDAVVGRLDAAECKEVRRGGERVVVIADPDGHMVELTERQPAELPPEVGRWFVDGRHHLATWLSAPESRELELDDVGPGPGRGPVAIGSIPDDGGPPTVEVVAGAALSAEVLRRFLDELGSG